MAEFNDGNGTTLPDQWAGAVGNGWATAWQQGGNAAGTGVVNTSPLWDSGNYLQFVDNTTTSPTYVRRQFQNFEGLDIAQPHRITLSYRFDGSGAAFTHFNDRIAIFGDTAAVTSSATSNTWLIGVAGSNTGAGVGQSVNPGEWYFFDNNGSNTFATSNMYDTNLVFVPGRAYAITIDVNPALGTYSASINDGVNPVVSASNLTFRSGSTGAASWFHVSQNSDAPTDNAAFSIDSVQIVPEPTAGLATLAGFAALSLLRRRRS